LSLSQALKGTSSVAAFEGCQIFGLEYMEPKKLPPPTVFSFLLPAVLMNRNYVFRGWLALCKKFPRFCCPSCLRSSWPARWAPASWLFSQTSRTCSLPPTGKQNASSVIMVAAPAYFDPDTDPDPDPGCHHDADPDPLFTLMLRRIRI
jgi:hypothetical protein